MPIDDKDLEDKLRVLLAAGRKIDAVVQYRAATGAGLAEAKDAVEALERGALLPSARPGGSTFEGEIISLLEQGRKIAAIQLYRRKAGVGLKEAKDFIDALAADRRISVPPRSGCLGVLLLCIV